MQRVLFICLTLVVAACASNDTTVPANFRINVAQETLGKPSQLIESVRVGDETALRSSIVAGDSVNAVFQGDTPLRVALSENRPRFVSILLRAGAVPDWSLTREQASALMLASANAMNDTVMQLIQFGSDIDYTNNAGWSALAMAAVRGHLTTVNILLNAGAEVDVYPEQESLLMKLVADNNMLIVRPLLDAGADVNFVSADGESALSIARKREYYELDLMLVQAGARL